MIISKEMTVIRDGSPVKMVEILYSNGLLSRRYFKPGKLTPFDVEWVSPKGLVQPQDVVFSKKFRSGSL